ncbi:MAG TPA: Flp pilus assembly protein CpaB [Thermaerobacter sp.]
MRAGWRTWASLAVAVLAGLTAYRVYLDATAALPVVVANRDLTAPVKIEPGMVSVALRPAAAVHPSAVTSLEDVVGRVLRRDVVGGEVVLTTDITPGEGGGLSLALPPGRQAFFVPTGLEQGLGGAVTAGDRVDVIFVGGEGPAAVSRTLLEAVPVLQVRDEEGRRLEEDGRPLGVLLAVTPGEAERLAYALAFGRVYLSLAPAAGQAAGGPGITWDSLFLPAEDRTAEVPQEPAPGSGNPPTGAAEGEPAGTRGDTPSPGTPGNSVGAGEGGGPGVPLVDPDLVEGEGDAP